MIDLALKMLLDEKPRFAAIVLGSASPPRRSWGRTLEGRFSASIRENASNEGRTNDRTSIVKSYRDAQGQRQETGSFRSDDLVLVEKLVRLTPYWTLARTNE
jgi:hypothetical protein